MSKRFSTAPNTTSPPPKYQWEPSVLPAPWPYLMLASTAPESVSSVVGIAGPCCATCMSSPTPRWLPSLAKCYPVVPILPCLLMHHQIVTLRTPTLPLSSSLLRTLPREPTVLFPALPVSKWRTTWAFYFARSSGCGGVGPSKGPTRPFQVSIHL